MLGSATAELIPIGVNQDRSANHDHAMVKMHKLRAHKSLHKEHNEQPSD